MKKNIVTVTSLKSGQVDILATEVLNSIMSQNGYLTRFQELTSLISSYELVTGKRYTLRQKETAEALMDQPVGSYEQLRSKIQSSISESYSIRTASVGISGKTVLTYDKATGLRSTDSDTQ